MPSTSAPSPDRGRSSGDEGNPTPSTSSSRETPTLLGSTPRNASAETPRLPGQEPADNEQSPLLSPSRSEDGLIDGQTVLGENDEIMGTKSMWYLLLLTISIGGLQIAWSVELSNGSPYLLSLGLSKSLMALVWIAGPLSGTLVQPYVGMLSDNCRLPWGRRKPFMLGGAVATIGSLMFLAYTREIVGGFLALFGADRASQGVKVTTIVIAVIGVYVLDFAINTVQAAIRAFIVDCAPPHQQEAANAMASRITGVGNIIGYIAGYANLPKIMWFLGNTQFKGLCAIASFALGGTVVLSCLVIPERDPRVYGPPPKEKSGVLAFFKKIFTSIKRLPPQTKQVCKVQFCAWIGFFPMLFYTSSYIGEIYVEPYLEENPNMTSEELDHLYEKATRVGTFALLIFSIVSLLTNLFLPFFVAPTYDSQPLVAKAPGEGPATAASSIMDWAPEKKGWLQRIVIPGFTLRRAWMLSQILFTVSMFFTVFVRRVWAATFLIGLVGITWALTLWAPWAIISAEISRRDAVLRARKQRDAALALALSPPSLDGYSSDRDHSLRGMGGDGDEVDQAGVILGIHNMAIAAPQIIATVCSSIIFKFSQKPRGVPGDHSFAIVLALGGITVLASAWFIHTIKDDATLPPDVLSAVEEGEGGDLSRPGTSSSGRPSYEAPPRKSYERATLVRNSSFGGMEY